MIMVASLASWVLGSFAFGLPGLKPNFGERVTLPVTGLWILASTLLGTASAQGNNRLVDCMCIYSERVCLRKRAGKELIMCSTNHSALFRSKQKMLQSPTIIDPSLSHPLTGTCYTLHMADSYGDGWNGNMWNWVDSSGAHSSSDTLTSGSSGTAQLCFPAGLDCMDFFVTQGQWSSEDSWYITDDAGVQQASGGSPFSAVPIGPCLFTSSFEADLDGWTTSTFIRNVGSTPSSSNFPHCAMIR